MPGIPNLNQNRDKNSQSPLPPSLQSLTCPHCKNTKRIKYGKQNGIQKYRCKNCGKHYRDGHGSPLYRTHKKHLTNKYLNCLFNALTVREAAKETGISTATAFAWRHKFLKRLQKQPTDIHRNSCISCLKTPYSQKGSRNPQSKTPTHIASTILIDTYNQFSIRLIQPDKTQTLKQGENAHFHLPHKSLPHLIKADKSPIRNGLLYTQSQATYTRAYRWLLKFRGVATKYLQNYWTWLCELHKVTQNQNISTCFNKHCLL